MNNTFYEIKFKYTSCDENGKMQNRAGAYLVDLDTCGASFTEAEAMGVTFFNTYAHDASSSIDIKSIRKTNINRIIVDDTKHIDANNWYIVTLSFVDEYDKSNNMNDIIIVNATSNDALNKLIDSQLNDVDMSMFDKRIVKSIRNVTYDIVGNDATTYVGE